MSLKPLSRREVLSASATAGATFCLNGALSAVPTVKRTFTILHTNDIHSNLIGLGPALDYSTDKLNDDKTKGGFARLAAMIAKRKGVREAQGPVLILDAGDYSMGTAFGAAIRETGGELQLLSRMGYDATTLGNHDFDLGPDGLAKAIGVAAKSGRIPAVVASNTDFSKDDPTLVDLQRLTKDSVIRQQLVIERGGIRFGIFGLMGKESIFYANGAGAVTFSDPVETAKSMVRLLRETKKVDVVICLSHGGLDKGPNGTFTDGEDVRLAKAVPGIDVVIGGHTHTELHDAIIVNDHTPVVQAGKYGENLGELVITLDGDKLTVESYQLHAIDDTIAGDKLIASEVERLKQIVSDVVFASRGYKIDQPLARIDQDIPNTFTDIIASTPLANLITDAFRKATGADIGFNANGTMRAGLTRGKTGVQTVYDLFAVTPLGAGVLDNTAGSTLVTAYFTGLELKHLLEYLLIENPAHPGEYFPRTSGLRFRYDTSRPRFDIVTAIEMGDLDRGYHEIDITGKDTRLFSLTSSLFVGMILTATPNYSKGNLAVVPKNKQGQPLQSKIEALDDPRVSTPDLLPPFGTLDQSSIATASHRGGLREIKEWQAIMDYIRSLPLNFQGELPTIRIDDRAEEVRAIKVG